MKVLIVLGCLSSVLMTRASLEPIGYSSRVSYPGSAYSEVSTPDSSYVPSSSRRSSGGATSLSSSGYDGQLSSSFSLPSKNSPRSFNVHRRSSSTSESDVYSSPAPRYQSANFLDSTVPEPASDYLPPRENQRDNVAPSNTYLSPNVQYDHSSDDLYAGYSASGRYSTVSTVDRRNKINRGDTRHDTSSRLGRKHESDPSEYRYNSPENQEPAKYEFEYKVKDDFGNDYSHKENRIGESTQGFYSVLLADGRTQFVHYEADSHGYRPTITYEDARSMSGYDGQPYQF